MTWGSWVDGESFKDRMSVMSGTLSSEEPAKVEEKRKVCEEGAERARDEVR